MAKIALVILILIASYSCTRVITEQVYNKEQVNSLRIRYSLPDKAYDIKELGESWVSFSLDSTRFMYRYPLGQYENSCIVVIK